MDRTILVEEEKRQLVTLRGVNIRGGQRLLAALLKADFDIQTALWLFLSDSGRWRLVLGSPLVDQEGPRSVYARVDSELVNLKPHVRISLTDIKVVGSGDKLVSALKTRPVLTEKLLTQFVIGGVFVEAAYIYDLRKCSVDKTK